MKTFRDYLSEEVTPSALVADGSIDIEKDAVRDNINGLLSWHQPSSVTPYNALMKVRKVLAYFSIHLPKRVYMEGKHGIEAWEINQFGDRMGMNDQGEFIKSVPAKYYLFFHYHMFGSMFSIRAKIVNREELDKELDMAEAMISEGAAMRQGVAKSMAPHEEMHDLDDESTESTKKAVEVSMRRKDKKLSADSLDEEQIDEVSAGLARRAAHRAFVKSDKMKADAKKEPDMHSYVQAVHKGEKKSKQGTKFAKYAAKKMEEEQVDEAKKEPVYTHEKGTLYGTVTDHGDGKFSTRRKVGMFWRTKSHKSKESAIAHLQNKKLKEEQIDELYGKGSLEKIRSHHQGEANKLSQGGRKQEKRMGALGRLHRDSEDREDAIKHHMGKAKKVRGLMSKLAMREETLDEKAPPGAKFERMVKHIKKGYSKDGLTKKEKSIAYATAWKAKKRETKD